MTKPLKIQHQFKKDIDDGIKKDEWRTIESLLEKGIIKENILKPGQLILKVDVIKLEDLETGEIDEYLIYDIKREVSNNILYLLRELYDNFELKKTDIIGLRLKKIKG